MLVMKFGGTSVGNAVRIREVAEIIRSRLPEKPVVIVSAVGGITDKLIAAAKKCAAGERCENELNEIETVHQAILSDLGLDKSLLQDELKSFREILQENRDSTFDAQQMDAVQSFGERMSVKILAAYLARTGTAAKAFPAWDIGMITNDEFGNAEPVGAAEEKIKAGLKGIKEVPIITGFIGKTADGHITTLGRGGSDYTAAIIGAALHAKEIQIWTDVDGVMSADPRIVKEAHTIDTLTFNEASELAYFGAKVLHPKTILPAMRKGIPVRVLNTYNPNGKGTVIVSKRSGNGQLVKAVSCKKNVSIYHIHSLRMLDAAGFLARIFNIFRDHKKSVDTITTSEVSVSLTVNNAEGMEPIVEELAKFAEVRFAHNRAIVCIIGEQMHENPVVPGKALTLMGRNNINVKMISQGASEINITLVMDNADADKAVRLLHKEFF